MFAVTLGHSTPPFAALGTVSVRLASRGPRVVVARPGQAGHTYEPFTAEANEHPGSNLQVRISQAHRG
jgi:hypothetical protein